MVTQPLLSDGGMAKIIKSEKPENYLSYELEVVHRQKVMQPQVDERFRNWTEKNEMQKRMRKQ